MTRKEANEQILNHLSLYFDTHPEIRFFQGLQNLGAQRADFSVYPYPEMLILDNFYEESETTLDKLNKNYNG